MGASSPITRTNVSSCAWLAAPLRSARRRQAASSTNTPGVAEFSMTHGDPGAVRPNQRRRLPMRACSPAASAPAPSGLAGCRMTMHSMSRSGWGPMASEGAVASFATVVDTGTSSSPGARSTISIGGDQDESSATVIGTSAAGPLSVSSAPIPTPATREESSSPPFPCALRIVGSTRRLAAGCSRMSPGLRKADAILRRMRRLLPCVVDDDTRDEENAGDYQA